MGDYGWQNRLYDFLKQSQGVKITRLDLAHDDYDGTYLNIDDLNERESNKEFYYFGKPARVTWYGDWKYLDRDKLGRTLQIGCRTSDKLLRAYEKGKQLGDKNSEWVRLEVELKAKHTHIPLMLLSIPLITSSTYIHALKNCLFTMIKSNPVLNTSSALYQSKLIKAWTFCVISLDVGWVSLENGLVMMKRVWRRSPYLLAFPKGSN